MKQTSVRMAIYVLVAVAAALWFFVFLAREPFPDFPINLIHLLTRH